MLSALIYGAAVIIIFYGLLDVAWKKWISKFSFLSCPGTIPWLGTAPYLEYEGHKFFKQMQALFEEHNYLMVLWIGYKPVVTSGCIEHAEVVLSSHEIITKSSLYSFIHEWLGTGLLTSNGSKWKSRRRAITPSFHFSILNDFVHIFEEQGENLVQQLRKEADTGKAINIQVPVSLATLDVICETAMGVQINAQGGSNSDYVKAVLSMNEQVSVRQRCPWLWPKFIYQNTVRGKKFYSSLKTLHGFTTDVINKRIESRQKTTNQVDSVPENDFASLFSKKKAFLDMLLDLYDKGEIDVDGIREEVDTFMFEGHDTTASGLSWILYLLGSNPDIQEKLHAEIDSVSLKSGDILEKIPNLKYLEYVIKEGLRLHPPVPLFGRVLEKDTVIDGNTIPGGTEIIIATIGLHTNPKYWDDSLVFRPERFGEEKFKKRNPYVFVPFSAGPRNCIGQKFAMLEEKVLLYYVISNFHIKSVQIPEEIEACIEIIHRSSNGLLIELYSRKNF